MFRREIVKAVVYGRYGSSKELGVAELSNPSINEDQLLIALRGAAINPLDWRLLIGTPYLVRMQSRLFQPNKGRFGSDFAGGVEAIGKSVSNFKVRVEVFGCGHGAVAAKCSLYPETVSIKAKKFRFCLSYCSPTDWFDGT
jgi:NADPH:quinone reductase-like Zn-dependent oxidoreductase